MKPAEHKLSRAIRFGVSYYPEFWPEDRWADDLDRMKEMGLRIVRVGEFAWPQMERSCDAFDVAWIERFCALAEARELQIFFCTPTATPPKWLMTSFPDARHIDGAGNVTSHYGRKYYCPNSASLRQRTQRLLGALVPATLKSDAVIAWQVDNEMGPHEVGICHCTWCAAEFRKWLQQEYRTLEALNAGWLTRHWGQWISAWDEVILPVGRAQPSVMADFQRFVTASWILWYEFQRDVLRDLNVKVPITTNFMAPVYEALDYWKFADAVDFIGMDHYISGCVPTASAIALDISRSLKRQPFWLVETGTLSEETPDRAHGELRLWAWRAYARGASALLYFRWRTCWSGAECEHPALFTHSDVPTSAARRLPEIIREFEEFEMQHGPLVLPQAKVAIGFDWDALLAHGAPGTYMTRQMASIEEELLAVAQALFERGVAVDFVNPAVTPLEGYALVVLPGRANRLDDGAIAARLTDYVQNGGFLLATTAFCSRNRCNNASGAHKPCGLTGLFGIQVGESREFPKSEYGIWRKESRQAAAVWMRGEPQKQFVVNFRAETLEVRDAEILQRYAAGYADGLPAATMRQQSGGGFAAYTGYAGTESGWTEVLDLCLEGAEVPTCGVSALEMIECGDFTIVLNPQNTSEILAMDAGEIVFGQNSLGEDGTLEPFSVLICKRIAQKGRSLRRQSPLDAATLSE